MATFRGENYKFPDEVDKPTEHEVEIEIEDDTPPEDRNRKLMDEPPQDFQADELSKYDESVRKRIQHFTKGYHEERRKSEAAQREKEEAIRAAQVIAEENKKLRGSLGESQSALIESAKLERPDLVILDYEMPGLSGQEVMGELRQIPGCEDLPIIFVTGRATPRVVESLREGGAREVLGKPFSPLHLIHLIHRFTGGNEA